MAQESDGRGGSAEQDRGFAGASSIELIGLAQAGNARALDVLYERYRPVLRRWATGRLPGWARDLVDTEDMVQETMVATLRNFGNFVPRHAGAFGAYLRQAIANRIRDEIRRVQARPVRAEMPDDHPDGGTTPLESAIGRDAMRRYEAALDQLSEPEREMVIARVEMGLSFPEIAATSQKASADAVRMAVTRALVRLAREMSRE